MVGVRGCRAGAGSAVGGRKKGCWQLQGEQGRIRGATAAKEMLSWPGAGLQAHPEGRH